MTRMAVLGAAQVSACGAGMGALQAGLEGAVTEPEWVPISRLEDGPRAPVLRARPEGLDEVVPPRPVRRLDDFAKSFIYTAMLAVADSATELPPAERIGVVTGTAYGSLVTSFALLDDIIFEGDESGSPFKFTTAVNNASATSVATILDARGPCVSVLGFQDILVNVLRVASMWLDEGRADVVIAGAGDEFHPMVGYGLSRLGGWAADGTMRPLDLEATTYVPGETFAALLLARADEVGDAGCVIEGMSCFADLARDYAPGLSVPQLLAADGRPYAAEAYGALVRRGSPVAAYAPLWGGNPSAEALNPLVAKLILERGRFYPVPCGEHASAGVKVAGPETPLEAGRLACVSANADGSGSVVTLSRGR